MSKDFDQLHKRDLDFVIGGEKFTMKFVTPEVIASFDYMEVEAEEADDDDPRPLSLRVLDKRILLFIEPGENEENHKRWRELRARQENPVSMLQLNALADWLIETQTGRPTIKPSPSGAGRGRAAATSAAG